MTNLTTKFHEFQGRLMSKKEISTQETRSDLSTKYQDISVAAQELAKSGGLSVKHMRSWSKQDDMGVPIQLRRFLVLDQFYFENVLRFIRGLIPNYWVRTHFQRKALEDDLNIVIKSGFESILKEHPVTETPFVRDIYCQRGFKFNSRYLRYVYIAGQIRKNKLLKEDTYQVHVDVGNFYGGLQALLKCYYPKTTFISVELEHQLFRSYIFHQYMFPNTQQIVGLTEFEEYSKSRNIRESAFVYLLPADFDFIDMHSEVNLLTNHLSYGEMSRTNFINYHLSATTLNAEKIHLVNRFVSSPFIDPTYDSDVTIFDYPLSSHKITYFDVFPIHHYMIIRRKLMNNFWFRNASSPQFEMILDRSDV
jgi:putative sugar O-methyltransferase